MRTAYVDVFVVFWCVPCGSWVSHRCLLSECEVRRSEAAGVVSGHRLRSSHVIGSGVDVHCTVTDAVSGAVSCVSVYRRWDTYSCLIAYLKLYTCIMYIARLCRPSCNWLWPLYNFRFSHRPVISLIKGVRCRGRLAAAVRLQELSL